MNRSPINTKSREQGFHFTKIFYEWSEVKIEFKNLRAKIWINNELITDSRYHSENG
jgi:hypothetical protein